MVEVTVYSRSNCHLCDVAMAQLEKLSEEFEFTIVKKLIDEKDRKINDVKQ